MPNHKSAESEKLREKEPAGLPAMRMRPPMRPAPLLLVAFPHLRHALSADFPRRRISKAPAAHHFPHRHISQPRLTTQRRASRHYRRKGGQRRQTMNTFRLHISAVN